jgi:chitin-binding protein
VAAATAAVLIGLGGGLLVSAAPASAHGASVFPGSRQYFCWVDGLEPNGQIIPKNPACQDAVAASGTTPLYNWFGNLHPSNAGGTVGSIPDGRICDGGDAGPFDFSPYNMARTDWPRTHLTAGDTYELWFNNWAAHPGRFDIYLTNQGWNPNTPLGWSDLELIQSVTDPPQTGPPGGLEFYFWDTTFPANRSGLHLLFIHWVRSDSPENFFSCSDIVFDGGNGEVSGLGGDPGEPDPGEPVDPTDPPTTPGPPIVTNLAPTSANVSWGAAGGFVTAYDLVNLAGGGQEVLATITGEPPATSTTLTNLTPDTSYSLAVRARNGNTGAESALTDAAPFSTPPEGTEPPPGDCAVTYETVNDWGAGFQAEVTITNHGSAPINNWQLGFTFPGSQQVSQLWNGLHSQSGAAVTVTNESWNSLLPAGGGTVNFGFLAAPGGGNSTPTGFTLNGAGCTVS